MAWSLLLVAGLLEIVWAFTMKLSQGFTRPGAYRQRRYGIASWTPNQPNAASSRTRPTVSLVPSLTRSTPRQLLKHWWKLASNRNSIDVLNGEEDLSRLDPTGTEHGVLERLQRAVIRTGGPVEEYKHLMRHVEDVRAGRWVIMVLAPKREARTIAGDILSAHGAEFVGFYGRWAWEGHTPSSDRATADGATEAHANAARPEDLPRLFVEAWNREIRMRWRRCSTRKPNS